MIHTYCTSVFLKVTFALNVLFLLFSIMLKTTFTEILFVLCNVLFPNFFSVYFNSFLSQFWVLFSVCMLVFCSLTLVVTIQIKGLGLSPLDEALMFSISSTLL